MKIDTMERIGLKRLATVEIDSTMFQYHVPAKRAEAITSLYHHPGKQFLACVTQYNCIRLDDSRASHISMKIIFTINKNCPFELVWGSREHYHKGPIISMLAPNLFCCGGASKYTNDDGTNNHSMQYEFMNKENVTGDDVTVAIRTLRNKMLRFLSPGVFDGLQLTSVAPSYSFKGCDNYFWEAVYIQCHFNTIAINTWGVD